MSTANKTTPHSSKPTTHKATARDTAGSAEKKAEKDRVIISTPPCVTASSPPAPP